MRAVRVAAGRRPAGGGHRIGAPGPGVVNGRTVRRGLRYVCDPDAAAGRSPPERWEEMLCETVRR